MAGPGAYTGPQSFTGSESLTGPQAFSGSQGYTGPQSYEEPHGYPASPAYPESQDYSATRSSGGQEPGGRAPEPAAWPACPGSGPVPLADWYPQARGDQPGYPSARQPAAPRAGQGQSPPATPGTPYWDVADGGGPDGLASGQSGASWYAPGYQPGDSNSGGYAEGAPGYPAYAAPGSAGNGQPPVTHQEPGAYPQAYDAYGMPASYGADAYGVAGQAAGDAPLSAGPGASVNGTGGYPALPRYPGSAAQAGQPSFTPAAPDHAQGAPGPDAFGPGGAVGYLPHHGGAGAYQPEPVNPSPYAGSPYEGSPYQGHHGGVTGQAGNAGPDGYQPDVYQAGANGSQAPGGYPPGNGAVGGYGPGAFPAANGGVPGSAPWGGDANGYAPDAGPYQNGTGYRNGTPASDGHVNGYGAVNAYPAANGQPAGGGSGPYPAAYGPGWEAVAGYEDYAAGQLAGPSPEGTSARGQADGQQGYWDQGNQRPGNWS